MMTIRALLLGVLVAAAASPARAGDDDRPKAAPAGGRVFELRTYHTHAGRLDALNTRFRDHTCRLFQKHGMELVGFWTPQDEKDGKGKTLVYLLAYPSRDAAKKSWDAFHADPEWQKVSKESEKDGPILAKVDSVFLDPTDYSPIK